VLIWYGPEIPGAAPDGEAGHVSEVVGIYSTTEKAFDARDAYREDYPTGELVVDDSYTIE
jgi:hypothetical protein